MEAKDTRKRLLDAAESLFAQNGIENTSLRAIIGRAGTNLASVHYHFGSKESLIVEVFKRRLQPINQERVDRLQALIASQQVSLEKIVEAFVLPAFRLKAEQGGASGHFMRLMGRVHSESEELKHLILNQFDEVATQFVGALSTILTELPQEELCLRFRFMIGAMAMLLLDVEPPDEECSTESQKLNMSIDSLISFVAAGMRAPMTALGRSKTAPA